MENEFKVGDVVTLKSGGAPMTVSNIGPDPASMTPDGMVRTCWMEMDSGHPRLRYGYFGRVMLQTPELRSAGPLPS